MRRMNSLLVCMVVVLSCVTISTARHQEEVPLPDLLVRRLELSGKQSITVYVLNKGKADALGSYVTIYGTDSSRKKTLWRQRFLFDPVGRGATVKMDFDISAHDVPPGTSLRAEIDSSQIIPEGDEANNTSELLVPEAPVPKESSPNPDHALPSTEPTTTPKPEVRPLISPDIAAVDIYFKPKHVVVVLKNVGDRDYEPLDAKIKDSFMRKVTLKRIVDIGATSYTEDLGKSFMGPARAGESFNRAYPYPKHVPGATKYTWIVTIEGEDPNPNNNTFKKVENFTKID